jgi:phospholipid transport system transporter-binding protein
MSGELSFATVGALSTEFTQQTPPKVVDLCDVTRTDSAGLALLIEWLKQSKATPITFRNIPAQMLSIATVCGVQDMLSQS